MFLKNLEVEAMKKLIFLCFSLIIFTTIFQQTASAGSLDYDKMDCKWGKAIGVKYCVNTTDTSTFRHKVTYKVNKKDAHSYFFHYYTVDPLEIKSGSPYWATSHVYDGDKLYYSDKISGFFEDNNWISQDVNRTLKDRNGGFPYGWVEMLHGLSANGATNNKTIAVTYFDPNW